MDFEHIYYDITEPNKSIILARDTAIVEYKGNKYEGPAEVRLDLLPTPTIYIYTQFAKLYCHDINSILLKKHNISPPGFVTEISASNSGTKVKWCLERSIISLGDTKTKMHKLIFHLFNVNIIRGHRVSHVTEGSTKYVIEHIDLKDDDNWEVEIKSLIQNSDFYKKLKSTGGFGLTHIGCIKRKDNSSFNGKEAKGILTALDYFLSFVKGCWCPPVLAVGLDKNSKRVWKEWSYPRYVWKYTTSCFNLFCCEQFSALFPGFMAKWNDEDWQDAIKETLYWYLTGNNLSEIDACIILAQAAIERLSYEYAVRDRKLIESEGFKKLRASDKFRLLFSSLDIPINIPAYCKDISQKAKQFNWLDNPHAITEIRNSLVHPDNKKRNQMQNLYWETGNLGLWYLELALLRIFDYNGKYQNRLTASEDDDVPWT